MFNTFWITSRWAMLPLLFGMIIINTFIPDFYWNSELFHVLIENGGSLIGFGLALIVLAMINKQQLSVNYIWLIAAFISMSTLDMFHSQIHPSQVFVWLHSVATFIGGLFAMLIWLPESLSKKFFKPFYFWLILLISIGFSIFSILMPDLILIMLDANKQFTSSADALNIMGGFGFLITWLYFVKEYHRHHHKQLFFFANHFALFGIAGLLFEFSLLWDANWWFWHMIRAFAYLFLIFRFSSIYRKNLLMENEQSKKMFDLTLAKNDRKYVTTLETLNKELQQHAENLSRKNIEKTKLASELEIYIAAINQHAIVSIANSVGKITKVNDKFCESSGYSRDELLGQDHHIVNSGMHPKTFFIDFWATISSGNKWHGEICNKSKNGSLYWVDSTIIPIKGEDGTIVNYFSVGIDITESKIREADLIAAKQEAELASNAKSDFLSSMSHELRTPLNAILGFSQLIEMSTKDENTKANIDEITHAGQHLLELIKDVLDLSIIESGKLPLSIEDVSLKDVFMEPLSFIKQLAEKRDIRVINPSSQLTKCHVRADYMRLKQVLLNLLTNAVKYNREGGSITISGESYPDNKMRISVTDTGLGMNESQLQQLFQKFNRVGPEQTDIEGTGIGLVIAKDLIELMGGTIGVESIEGKGTSFWVELDLASRNASKASTLSSSAYLAEPLSSQARILIAEDNMSNQMLLKQQLNIFGLNADFADNGIQAWEQWNKRRYDLLLTDINMPLMNGYELVDRIRKAEQETGEHVPIIAITGNAMEDDVEHCLKAGMDAFVSKPIRLADLKATLNEWLPIDGFEEVVEKEIRENTENDVDISMLISLVGDHKDKHCLLFKSFIDSTPDIIQEIQTAYKDQITEIIKQQAHKLKSSARSIGANELADVCQALETAGKSDNWNDIEGLVPRLDALFKSVKAYANNYCDSEQVTEPIKKLSLEQPRILLVDDDPLLLDIETMILNELGIHDVCTAISGKDALAILDDLNESIDVVMCDLNMPEMDGLEFLRHLADKNYEGSVILVSGEDARILKTSEMLVTEHQLNLLGTLKKPITPSEIKSMLKKTLSKPKLKQTTQQQMVITAEELRHGIENDELVVFFQPKIDVVSREVIGIEALVRWQHPDKGLIAPYLFISVAEKNGLIDALTKVVFKQAMQHAANLHALGFNINVAVNISADTLNDLDWPDYAMAQASNAGIDPSNITIEITESRLMDNLVSALEILTRLSMKKFKLSIDDFGTGYSSMEQLQRVPFSELKIDRAFVNGATHDKSSRAILESSVGLAKKLGMSIVAEGVETQEDWDLVAELCCDQVQGYFIAKPMSIDDLVPWLELWRLNSK